MYSQFINGVPSVYKIERHVCYTYKVKNIKRRDGNKKGKSVLPYKIQTAMQYNQRDHVIKWLKDFDFGKYFSEKQLIYENTKFSF